MEALTMVLAVFAILVIALFMAAAMAYLAGYGFTYGERAAQERIRREADHDVQVR